MSKSVMLFLMIVAIILGLWLFVKVLMPLIFPELGVDISEVKSKCLSNSVFIQNSIIYYNPTLTSLEQVRNDPKVIDAYLVK